MSALWIEVEGGEGQSPREWGQLADFYLSRTDEETYWSHSLWLFTRPAEPRATSESGGSWNHPPRSLGEAQTHQGA
ncbi:hypothetical protein AAFF_G00337260 [Aldrovandia affinis]|uniref:Uncharacterized protein n=1 Tax=Aldrovandia affinis TaxID=143900 RepID=A0AAD7WQB6_9TELE|nr:hypothetical protein AAFF_G00337260 [Aldrovandia affinis]